MLFNSYVFLFVFLPITWMSFRFACAKKKTAVALVVLMLASLVFYSYWNPPFVFLILFSVLFNFTWGRIIEKNLSYILNKNPFLYIGVGVNLSLIAYFKYANFLMSNIAFVIGWEWSVREIFLPLGISFFTFQQIAYLIDCSRGIAKEHTFTNYALFVTFFPQLIAGPIVRYEEIMPQFLKTRTFSLDYKNLAIGATLFALGFFKKLVIADTLSPWVAAAFDSNYQLTFIEAWGGVLSYTFQIYFDFSGYSDMALGLAKLFNIEIPINFNSPYKAISIIDFWRRWHITLSTFLRDYLYIPLGGNRKGAVRRYINLFATMALGGLWHGASWNFVIWGSLHGFFLILNHLFRQILLFVSLPLPRLFRPFGWLLTFISVVFAWVFFRALSFSRAIEILYGLIGANGVVLRPNYVPFKWFREILTTVGVEFTYPNTWTLIGGKEQIIFLVACMFLILFFPNSNEWCEKSILNKKFTIHYALFFGIVFAISTCFLSRASEFLYFQF